MYGPPPLSFEGNRHEQTRIFVHPRYYRGSSLPSWIDGRGRRGVELKICASKLPGLSTDQQLFPTIHHIVRVSNAPIPRPPPPPPRKPSNERKRNNDDECTRSRARAFVRPTRKRASRNPLGFQLEFSVRASTGNRALLARRRKRAASTRTRFYFDRRLVERESNRARSELSTVRAITLARTAICAIAVALVGAPWYTHKAHG